MMSLLFWDKGFFTIYKISHLGALTVCGCQSQAISVLSRHYFRFYQGERGLVKVSCKLKAVFQLRVFYTYIHARKSKSISILHLK